MNKNEMKIWGKSDTKAKRQRLQKKPTKHHVTLFLDIYLLDTFWFVENHRAIHHITYHSQCVKSV